MYRGAGQQSPARGLLPRAGGVRRAWLSLAAAIASERIERSHPHTDARTFLEQALWALETERLSARRQRKTVYPPPGE
jgi:hypothetical protein